MIYFMRCANSPNVKIGFTDRDPKVRIREFGLPNVELLATCLGDRQVERDLFHRFRRWRVSPSSEWFSPGPELMQYIESLKGEPDAGVLSDAINDLWAQADELFQVVEVGLWDF